MLTAEAIQEIKRNEHQPQVLEADNLKYIVSTNDYNVKVIAPEKPVALACQSLDGLITYLRNATPSVELWEGQDKYLINIVGHEKVKLVSGLEPKFMMRREYITATAKDASFRFMQYIGIEEFIISTMASFVQDENTKTLLNFVSSIQALFQSNQDDDGASQSVTIKKSITSVGVAKVPNPVALRPYCTFPEITQPLRQYVFRMRQEDPKHPVHVGLFTTDSDLWKTEAVESVREYLQEQIRQYDLPAVIIS